MFDDSDDRTASLMTPARLVRLQASPPVAASPAAWLDQMADGVGGAQVHRLLDLRQQLAALLRTGELRALVGGCEALHNALAQVDFALLQPRGWLARFTGQGRDGAAGFAVQQRAAAEAGDALAEAVRTLHRQQQAQGTAVERTLLQFELELRALDKIIDQGARWLQDMGHAGQAQGGAAGEDAARCALLLARLDLLRAAGTATRQVLQHCRTAGAARAELAARCRASLDEGWQAWRRQAEAAAAQAAEDGCAGDRAGAARQSLPPLQVALQQADADARAVQAADQALADEVAALQAALQAAT